MCLDKLQIYSPLLIDDVSRSVESDLTRAHSKNAVYFERVIIRTLSAKVMTSLLSTNSGTTLGWTGRLWHFFQN